VLVVALVHRREQFHPVQALATRDRWLALAGFVPTRASAIVLRSRRARGGVARAGEHDECKPAHGRRTRANGERIQDELQGTSFIMRFTTRRRSATARAPTSFPIRPRAASACDRCPPRSPRSSRSRAGSGRTAPSACVRNTHLGEPNATCRAHAVPACGRPLEPGWTFACGESSLREDRRPTWTPSSLLDSVHFGSLGRQRSTRGPVVASHMRGADRQTVSCRSALSGGGGAGNRTPVREASN
jgi:hypothetical protein